MRHLLLCLPLLAVAGSSCSCQRDENVAAKARLSEPPPPNPVHKLAEEVLDVRGLDKDAEAFKRVARMSFSEARRRLGTLTFTSAATFKMERSALAINSREDIAIQASDDGDFSLKLETGDGGRQEVVFANGVLFLKNNNGRWRASRDPTGERDELLEDSAGVWRTFYDLFAHTLKLEPPEELSHEGRAAVRYRFSLPDASAEVGAEVKEMPSIAARSLLPLDAGVPTAEQEEKERQEVMERVQKWRERTRPAGGKGTLVFDRETGVLLATDFTGSLLISDARNPAKLNATLKSRISAIGKPVHVAVPEKAVDEVTRKKWPVRPREVLEQAGLVPKLEAAASKDGEAEKKAGGGEGAP